MFYRVRKITCRPVGNFLCVVWQHCRRPWSFTCEPCLVGSGRTGFEWDVFEVTVLIQRSAKCKVCSILRFLNTKSKHPAEIHKQIVAVYGDIMNWQNVTKWCREFSEGRTDVHDEQRSSRPSLFCDKLLQKIEGEIHANRRRTIRELHHIIP
jgi:phage FluMu protein Com